MTAPGNPAPALRLAAAQFPVGADIAANGRQMLELARAAADGGASAVLFPETALTGYSPDTGVGASDLDWETLRRCEAEMAAFARSRRLAVIYGSLAPAVSRRRALNVLRAIGPDGVELAAYSKRRLYGRETDWFEAGTRAVTFDLGGVRCGLLICYDNCFPELYEEYRRLGVEVLFQGFYNAGRTEPSATFDRLVLSTLIVRSGDTGLWIVATNSSAPHSVLPACIVAPDGSVEAIGANAPGIAFRDWPGELGFTWYGDRAARAAARDPEG